MSGPPTPPAPPTDADIIQTAADELPAGVWIARAPGGEFVYANRAFREIMGMEARPEVAAGEYAAPYGIHTRTGELYPEERMPFVRALAARTTVVVDDIVIHRADGRRVFIRAQARPVFAGPPPGAEPGTGGLGPADSPAVTPPGTITHVVIAFIDISREVEAERARLEAEARLARGQRMESVGNLAGGVAHDFNNLLAVVRLLGASLRRTERDALRLEDLRAIDEVVDSAAGLTRSLLSFAGRDAGRPERVPLDRMVSSIVSIVSRALDKRIDVRAELGADADVLGDTGQLEQVLMNLVVNARDALPETGTITVRTTTRDLDAAAAARLGRLGPGPCVVLEVADDGTGIDSAIRERIFEPYFTTKTAGPVRGTGLGLATVYGIVEAHGGAIEVVENIPRGTIARVFLPRAQPGATARPPPVRPSAPATEGGTVLLVEDERLVRSAARRALQELGYSVLEASDGIEAVERFRAHQGEIDVVILDMNMPRLSGRGTYRALRQLEPEVRVVLTTGYARSEEAEGILDLGVRELLEKPYRVEALAEVVGRLVRERRRRGG